MRIFSLTILIVAFSIISKSSAEQFSANAFIKECLNHELSPSKKQNCRGFFYGLISKKQHLLNPDERGGVIERAMNNRTPTASYAAVTKRTLGVNEICLPNDLTYEDFTRELKLHQQRTKSTSISVESISAVLAKAYSC